MTAKKQWTREEVIEKLEEIRQKERALLINIQRELPSLEKILEHVNSHWGEEDKVYRFYHESKKLYPIQGLTKAIYSALERISPHQTGEKIPDRYYQQIIREGMFGREHKLEDNQNWAKVCRPMLEALFHSKYFLEMAIKYGKEYPQLPSGNERIKSGWAALLELYGLRHPEETYCLILMVLEQKEREAKCKVNSKNKD